MDYKKPCIYCQSKVELVKGDVVYPALDELHHKNFYKCSNVACDAYVGCHSGTTKPMGIVARKGLRALRHQCHLKFDAMWKKHNVKRHIAYQWLAYICNVQSDCPERLKDRKTLHFGYMREPECNFVLELIDKDLESSLMTYQEVEYAIN